MKKIIFLLLLIGSSLFLAKYDHVLLNFGIATEKALFESEADIRIKFSDGSTSSISISNEYGIRVKNQVLMYFLDWPDVKHISFEQHKGMKLFIVESGGKRLELGYVTEATAKRIIEEVGSQAKVLN